MTDINKQLTNKITVKNNPENTNNKTTGKNNGINTSHEEYRKRKHAFTVRMNDEEYDAFEHDRKKSGLSRQEYSRRANLSAPIRPAYETNKLYKIDTTLSLILKQLRGIANNINQMARHANINHDLPNTETLNGASDTIYEFTKTCYELRSCVDEMIKNNCYSKTI